MQRLKKKNKKQKTKDTYSKKPCTSRGELFEKVSEMIGSHSFISAQLDMTIQKKSHVLTWYCENLLPRKRREVRGVANVVQVMTKEKR